MTPAAAQSVDGPPPRVGPSRPVDGIGCGGHHPLRVGEGLAVGAGVCVPPVGELVGCGRDGADVWWARRLGAPEVPGLSRAGA